MLGNASSFETINMIKMNFMKDGCMEYNHGIYNFLFQYDLSASQFSPDGRVFQVEYAQKAVENSG